MTATFGLRCDFICKAKVELLIVGSIWEGGETEIQNETDILWGTGTHELNASCWQEVAFNRDFTTFEIFEQMARVQVINRLVVSHFHLVLIKLYITMARENLNCDTYGPNNRGKGGIGKDENTTQSSMGRTRTMIRKNYTSPVQFLGQINKGQVQLRKVCMFIPLVHRHGKLAFSPDVHSLCINVWNCDTKLKYSSKLSLKRILGRMLEL